MSQNDSQLLLPLGPVHNSELFSNYWLNNRLPLEPDWHELLQEAERVLTRLRQVWKEQRSRVEKYGKEAPLEEAFIQPVLEVLGWKLFYQAHVQEGKRRVAEQCLYGVDVNPLAVELAKLALWLETVSKDRPLAFLDHHLRVGNSLIGAKLSLLDRLPGATDLFSGLFTEEFSQKREDMLQPLHQLRSMDSKDAAAVKQKERLLRQYEVRVNGFLALDLLHPKQAPGFSKTALFTGAYSSMSWRRFIETY